VSASDPLTSAPTPPRSRTKWLAAFVVLGAVVCGMLVGFAGSRVLAIHRMRSGAGVHIPPPWAGETMLMRLDRRLDLTDEQHDEIRSILLRRHGRMIEVTRSVHPQVRAELEAANAEISRVLTPEQRKKFETMRMRIPGLGRH
jgi:Spy/CpxP family protein refolding chaperone